MVHPPKQSTVGRIGKGSQWKVVWSKLNNKIKYIGGGLARERLVLISRITLLGWVTCFTRGLHVGGGANATSIRKVSKARATVLLAWI